MTIEAALSSALEGMVVIEAGNERSEFAGLLLAMFGADVVKIEGRQGSNSRRLGPFVKSGPDIGQSLCFSRYNLGKRSMSFELEHPRAAEVQRQLDLLALPYRCQNAPVPHLTVHLRTPLGLRTLRSPGPP